MAPAAPPSTLRVALLGNPNTGKTTIFNMLTGFRARVGNYAGVTVERKTGPLKDSSVPVEIIDLPGTYSLAARSADEMVAVDVLMGYRSEDPRPDLVLIVLDASNLERNLFLTTQAMESGLPCAAVLNMVDVAEAAEIRVKAEMLAERLGIPIFPAVASKEKGFEAIREYLQSAAERAPATPFVQFPEAFEYEVTRLREALVAGGVTAAHAEPFLLRRALLEQDGMAEQRIAQSGGAGAKELLAAARANLKAQGFNLVTMEAKVRYGAIRKALDGVVERPKERRETSSDRIDKWVVHPVWGTGIFVLLMLTIFQAIYSWSAPFMDMIDGAFGLLGEWIGAHMAEGPLKAFLIDGVVTGVGGVLVFLPQITVLFFFLAVLEDCGYIARAAFLMDRLLSRIGLSGRSFIPMLSSFACAIPGIMATRTIEDRRDRFTTILVAPLMSCSARLPVYTLLIGAFIPDHRIGGLLNLQGLTLLAMYLVGMVIAIGVALLLKRTLLKGATPTFIMELPPYRMPVWKNVVYRLLESAGAFVKRAGTVIFAVAVIVWALTYYPRPASVETEVRAEHAEKLALAEKALEAAPESEELAAAVDAVNAEIDNEIQGRYLRQSFLGRMGHVIEPAVEPLGWDWKIGMAALASFPAREVVVATLGILYDLGADTDEESTDLRETLRQAKRPDGTPAFTIATALSLMVFFALCAQCAATLAVIRRETNSWRWPLFSFAYMTTLAYVGALVTFQVARHLLGL